MSENCKENNYDNIHKRRSNKKHYRFTDRPGNLKIDYLSNSQVNCISLNINKIFFKSMFNRLTEKVNSVPDLYLYGKSSQKISLITISTAEYTHFL